MIALIFLVLSTLPICRTIKQKVRQEFSIHRDDDMASWLIPHFAALAVDIAGSFPKCPNVMPPDRNLCHGTFRLPAPFFHTFKNSQVILGCLSGVFIWTKRKLENCLSPLSVSINNICTGAGGAFRGRYLPLALATVSSVVAPNFRRSYSTIEVSGLLWFGYGYRQCGSDLRIGAGCRPVRFFARFSGWSQGLYFGANSLV